jgi:hypothetical protein
MVPVVVESGAESGQVAGGLTMKPDERAFLIAVASRPRETYREGLERRIRASHPLIANAYRQQLARPIVPLDAMTPIESVGEVGARLGIHPKRVNYLLLKWAGRDWLDYGTSPGMGWLTVAGKARAAELDRPTLSDSRPPSC